MGLRLPHDDLRNIRRTPRGHYQARATSGGQRHNLGCFRTPQAARDAITRFWRDAAAAGRPKFVRPIRVRDPAAAGGSRVAFYARVRHAGREYNLGRFPTLAEAGTAVALLVAHAFPHDADAVLARE